MTEQSVKDKAQQPYSRAITNAAILLAMIAAELAMFESAHKMWSILDGDPFEAVKKIGVCVLATGIALGVPVIFDKFFAKYKLGKQ